MEPHARRHDAADVSRGTPRNSVVKLFGPLQYASFLFRDARACEGEREYVQLLGTCYAFVSPEINVLSRTILCLRLALASLYDTVPPPKLNLAIHWDHYPN